MDPKRYFRDSHVPQPYNLLPSDQVRCMNCGEMVSAPDLQGHMVARHLGPGVEDAVPFGSEVLPYMRCDCFKEKDTVTLHQPITRSQVQPIRYQFEPEPFDEIELSAPHHFTLPDHPHSHSPALHSQQEQPEDRLPIFYERPPLSQSYKPETASRPQAKTGLRRKQHSLDPLESMLF
jgi:hypothetical protein